MSSRAIRRHHANRLKHKRQRYWEAGYGYFSGFKPVTDPRVLGKLVHTTRQCACWMCKLHGGVSDRRFGRFVLIRDFRQLARGAVEE